MTDRAPDTDAGRRAFLRGQLLTSTGREEYRRSREPLGLPPPWHGQYLVQATCAACEGRCVAACPENIIHVHPAGHALAGLPYLSFEQAGCTWCGECVDVCPLKPVREPERPALGEAHLDMISCLAWNDVFCVSCADRCEYGAIKRDRRSRVGIDARACVGCGACLAACPESAITLKTVPA